MKYKIFIFLTLVFFCGKISAEDVPEKIKISTLEPLSLEIDHSPFTIHHLPLKDPLIAWLISFPGGMLGLHRLYLGTDTKTIMLYIATFGGVFGIVPMMDWILLMQGIQKGDISKYVNNRRFIMWL
jgi:TM2 domain-containing membrane protein YozV